MQFPNTIQYKQAVQDPESFATLNNDLHPVMDGYEPVLASGNFAVVFKMLQNDKKHALKCFTKEIDGRAERQKMIVEYIKQNPSEHFVEYHYLENELWIAEGEGMEVPVTWMEWVEAPTLGEKIKEYCESKDTDGLQSLVENFREFALWILQQPFAHGDLKHDNLLVKEDGKLVMVDYDGMFIPAFEGFLANELGSKGYQHPKRTANYFNDNLDDFSIVVIYISLLALVEDPELYHKYNNGQNIIFDTNDFINPEKSTLITNLKLEIGIGVKVGEFAQICKNPCQSLINIKELIDAPITRKEYLSELEETKKSILSHFKQLSLNNQLGKSQFRLTEEILDSQTIITTQLFENLQKKLPLKSFSEERVLTEEWWYSLSEEWRQQLLKNLNSTDSTDPFIAQDILPNLKLSKSTLLVLFEKLARLKKISIYNISGLRPLIKLTNLEDIEISNSQLTDLKLLQQLESIKSLSFSRCKFEYGINDAFQFTGLNSLTIDGCWVADDEYYSRVVEAYDIGEYESISDMVNLESLTIIEPEIIDLTPFSYLKKLKYLHISSSQIEDLTPLAKLDQLESLILGDIECNDVYGFSYPYKNINELSPLQSLKKLKVLQIRKSIDGVKNLNPISNLTSLTELELNYNEADLSPISKLMNLKSLVLGKNLGDLSPISKLTNLTNLDLWGNTKDLSPLRHLIWYIRSNDGTIRVGDNDRLWEDDPDEDFPF